MSEFIKAIDSTRNLEEHMQKSGCKWVCDDVRARDFFATSTARKEKYKSGASMLVERIKLIEKINDHDDCPICNT